MVGIELEVPAGTMLDKLTFDKSEILETLRTNRDEHREIFLEALAGYEARMQEELQRRLEDLKNHRPVDQIISLEVPQDHTSEYDTVISMLERSKDEYITLSMSHYNCYVMDNWSWRGNFLANATQYGSASAAGKFSNIH